MKKIILVLVCLAFVTPASAATVYLNSGASVEGAIVEKTSNRVKVEVSGVPVTYYKDEITRIEGDDEAAQALGLLGATAEPVQEAEAAVVPVVEEPVVANVSEPEVALPVEGDKREKILKFIEVFGTKEAMRRNFDQMMGSLSAEQAIAFRGSFNIDDIIEALLPLYEKHFTGPELDAFVGFYGSEAGRKLVDTLPVIMKESVDVSAAYFEKNMPESLRNAKPEGAQKQ